jgi:hypothetical protein
MGNDPRQSEGDSVPPESSDSLPASANSAGEGSSTSDPPPKSQDPSSARSVASWRRVVWLATLTTASGGALLGLLDFVVTSSHLGGMALHQRARRIKASRKEQLGKST